MKTQKLVTQSGNQTVTVGVGRVPIIKIESKDGLAEAVMAINFIRSGCPEVQMVIRNGHEELLKTHQEMSNSMIDLQLNNEKFWLFGKPKLEIGGNSILIFKYHPSMKKTPDKRKC